MTYKLAFHPKALKEWKKLSEHCQQQFKKVLEKRLISPHVESAKLKGHLKDCYKIKLRKLGYRLVYSVDDGKLLVLIVAVGRRDKAQAYLNAQRRQ